MNTRKKKKAMKTLVRNKKLAFKKKVRIEKNSMKMYFCTRLTRAYWVGSRRRKEGLFPLTKSRALLSCRVTSGMTEHTQSTKKLSPFPTVKSIQSPLGASVHWWWVNIHRFSAGKENNYYRIEKKSARRYNGLLPHWLAMIVPSL